MIVCCVQPLYNIYLLVGSDLGVVWENTVGQTIDERVILDWVFPVKECCGFSFRGAPICPQCRPHRKLCFQQFLHCCMFTHPLPSSGCFSGSLIPAVRPHVTIYLKMVMHGGGIGLL